MQDITLVLLAAGNSSRFGKGPKKQWLYQDDTPLWLFVAQNFQNNFSFSKIIIVANIDEIAYMRQFADFTYVTGGNTRQKSVQNALQETKSKYVLISDIARCCVDMEMIQQIIEQKAQASCIVPSLQIADTVYLDNTPIEREKLLLVQTPQLSLVSDLALALQSGTQFTDESSAIDSIGKKVLFTKGSQVAHKLTYKDDLLKLPCLKAPSTDTFTGFGIDTHPFCQDKAMKLCGIPIDSPFGFQAHSDGDVAIHSLIDALLGATGMGDIGELFPDNDPAYSNIDSTKLLDIVVKRVTDCGFQINNIDMTIVAQEPKIAPYKQLMRTKIATILQIKPNRVNIKATTSEKLGFIGRSEGVTVHTVASIIYYNWRKDI